MNGGTEYGAAAVVVCMEVCPARKDARNSTTGQATGAPLSSHGRLNLACGFHLRSWLALALGAAGLGG